jgi:HD superfamily phosphohydrolase YqeK
MREAVIHWLTENVSAHRLEHILGVEKLSAELAEQHGVDRQKAAQAGLMHDLAKFFPPPRLLAIAEEDGIELDDVGRGLRGNFPDLGIGGAVDEHHRLA